MHHYVRSHAPSVGSAPPPPAPSPPKKRSQHRLPPLEQIHVNVKLTNLVIVCGEACVNASLLMTTSELMASRVVLSTCSVHFTKLQKHIPEILFYVCSIEYSNVWGGI